MVFLASSSPSPVATVSTAGATTPSSTAANRSDYMLSEEEFQFQLALAINASNSEFRDDSEKDQTLGRHERMDNLLCRI